MILRKYLPLSMLSGKPGSLYEHNLDRLRDLWKLRGYYWSKGILHKYAVNLIFWYFAYALLTFRDEEAALSYTKRFIFNISTPNTEYLGQSVFVPVLKAYWENTPFLLSNLGFRDKFNITDEMITGLSLKTVNKPMSVNERVAKTREKKQSKRISVSKRRQRINVLRNNMTVVEIAKAEGVSVSTIEGDLRYLRKIQRERAHYADLKKLIIAKITGSVKPKFSLRMAKDRRISVYLQRFHTPRRLICNTS